MGWEDRPYYRDHGASSNPLAGLLTGSVPLFTAFGVRVRAHNWLIIFILCELLLDWTKGFDLPSKLVSMGLLVGVILLHEYGHCLAARLVGGSAPDIMLWPLGGLAFPDTPQRPGARFLTAAGGPLMNVVICLLAACGVWLLASHTLVPLNPLDSVLPPMQMGWHKPAFYCWWLFVVSYLLLILNMLPIIPLDAGRMIQAILWRFVGHYRSMIAACVIGMCGAAMVGIVGMVRFDLFLILLGAGLFLMCYQERLIQREIGPLEPWQDAETDYSSSLYQQDSRRKPRRVSKRALRIARQHAQEELAERQRLDAILTKVSASGISSLTWREKRALHSATERRRKHSADLRNMLQE